jgi:hypothetical protein
MYSALITIHAVTATTALAAAFGGRRQAWFTVHRASMWLMLVSLTAAIAVDAGGRDVARHVVTGGLVGLGSVMVAHTELAARTRDTRRVIDHIGFTVVGLVDAFVVVTVFNAGAPGWLTAAIGASIAVVGHLAIRRVRATHAPAPVP